MTAISAAETISQTTIDELLSVQPDDITTLVDQGVEFIGSLKVTSGRTVLVSGVLEGSIHSNGAVIVNVGAEVRGSITCRSLQVAGRVVRLKDDDLLDVEQAIVLAKSARVLCDARAGGLKTEYGSSFSGRYEPRFAEEGAAANGAASVAPMQPVASQQLARATHVDLADAPLGSESGGNDHAHSAQVLHLGIPGQPNGHAGLGQQAVG